MTLLECVVCLFVFLSILFLELWTVMESISYFFFLMPKFPLGTINTTMPVAYYPLRAFGDRQECGGVETGKGRTLSTRMSPNSSLTQIETSHLWAAGKGAQM